MSRRTRPTETTGGSDEREARLLSVPLSRFELVRETARLRAEEEYAGGDRNGRTLAKVGAFRLVLVAFRSGARFDEVDQRGSVALQVLEGRVAVRVDAETVELGVAEIAVVAPDHPWTAVALADGVMLIHLAWPPEPATRAERPRPDGPA